ncbi:LPS biosynthesis protein [Thermoplasmatales archaeon SCGC AB-539-N05]|nr:LPS biosynthesis protein [Thermoplasmatales archaeon SCGC AB-539-N05]
MKKRNMCNKEQAAKDLRQVNEIFKKYSLDCWLDYGALLGAIRDNDFIPWDEDIDLGYIGDGKKFYDLQDVFEKKGWKLFPKYGGIKILNANHTSKIDINLYSYLSNGICRVYALYNTLGNIMDFVTWILSLYPVEYKYETRLSLTTLKKIENVVSVMPSLLRRTILYITILVHDTIGCEKHSETTPREYIEPLKATIFKDVDILIPNNPMKYLEFLYGYDWKTPKQNWRAYKKI